jgi:leucyl aminopeptidase (aminopeptidase T)
MPDSGEVKGQGDVKQLMRGARNAMASCLSVTADDRVTLVCDESTLKVAAALLQAAEETGAEIRCFVLERHVPRPAVKLPPDIVRALEKSTVSIYACHPQEGEVPHRFELIEMVKPLKLRHAHMIQITEDAMMQGMLSDYRQVAKLNDIMVERVGRAGSVRVTSRVGTDVSVTLDPAEPWESSAGVIEPGRWLNLPNGEILTCPAAVDGIFVCDGVVPAADQPERFDIGRKPLRFEVAGGRLVSLTGGPGDLAERVLATIRAGTNLDRIGMFAVGTNFELLMPIGDAIQDLFIPGAYFSFGRSPASGGAKPSWEASAQLTFTGRKTTLELDGFPVIRDGRYDPRILAETES